MSGNRNIAKDPLARFLEIFDKRIVLKVRRFGSRIVDFNPTRIVTIFIEPVQIDRRNFGNDQG